MIQSYRTPSSRMDRIGTVKFKAESMDRDELGQYPVVEKELATIWCGVTPQTGTMLSGRAADTQLADTTHKVVIRYRPDIRPDMWLEIEGTRYDILYVLDPYLRHETLELFCEVKQR